MLCCRVSFGAKFTATEGSGPFSRMAVRSLVKTQPRSQGLYPDQPPSQVSRHWKRGWWETCSFINAFHLNMQLTSTHHSFSHLLNGDWWGRTSKALPFRHFSNALENVNIFNMPLAWGKIVRWPFNGNVFSFFRTSCRHASHWGLVKSTTSGWQRTCGIYLKQVSSDCS